MEEYITTQHRYYTLDYYLKKRFNSKVFKVALNGGFTCPNRDGTISYNGCIFCSKEGSGEFGGKRGDPLSKQFKEVKDIISLKWKNAKYIVYFQANTNTYAKTEYLRKLYYEAIGLDRGIVAISIATRPDCLEDDVIDLLSEINEKIPVIIELGLQTANDTTAKLINRGYKREVFTDAVKRLREKNIEVVTHIINGLPGESSKDMLETINYLNSLDIQGIKIHSLFVLKGTVLEQMYNNKEFELLSMKDYIDITVQQLCLLRSDIVVHRISGDAPIGELVAPLWSVKKLVVMNEIDKKMKKDNLYQGMNHKK